MPLNYSGTGTPRNGSDYIIRKVLNEKLGTYQNYYYFWVQNKEDLKNELTTIVMTQTSSGAYARDKWDTPETKGAHGKKGKLRKDRYSSLLISNMIARQLDLTLADVEYNVIGGSTRTIVKSKDSEMYKGPEWFTGGANDDIYIGINK